MDDIVGRPIDFFSFTKLPQTKVVVQQYLSVREQHKKMGGDGIPGEIATEMVSLIWTMSMDVSLIWNWTPSMGTSLIWTLSILG